MPIGYCGRNRRFFSSNYLPVEQSSDSLCMSHVKAFPLAGAAASPAHPILAGGTPATPPCVATAPRARIISTLGQTSGRIFLDPALSGRASGKDRISRAKSCLQQTGCRMVDHAPYLPRPLGPGPSYVSGVSCSDAGSDTLVSWALAASWARRSAMTTSSQFLSPSGAHRSYLASAEAAT